MRVMVQDGKKAREQEDVESKRKQLIEAQPYIGVLTEQVRTINKQLSRARPSRDSVSQLREDTIKEMREHSLLKPGELPRFVVLSTLQADLLTPCPVRPAY